MKKTLAIILSMLPFIFQGCESSSPESGSTDATSGASIPSGEENQGGSTASEGKTLIVFFSRPGENWQVGKVERGNTAIMVDYISETIEADLFEIVPVSPYPESYDETLTVATDEKNSKARPSFKGKIEDIGQYSNVFIGGPIWWGEPPMILRSFCEAYPELDGKTIIPFGTHGGSGVGSYLTMLKSYYPKAKFLESLGISGSSVRKSEARKDVEKWIKSLGFHKEEE